VVGYRSERNKEYDLKAMIGGSSSTDIKEALGAKKRSDFDEKRKRRWLRRSTRWTRSSLPIRTIYRESLKFEKTTMSRVLSRKAGEIDLIWSESDPESRAGLMLDYIMATAPDLLPTSGALLKKRSRQSSILGTRLQGVCFDFGYDSTIRHRGDRLSTCSTVFRTHGVVERGQ
jgi:hypothetical protein